MEVIFEEEDGSSFTMEINSSDTVWEIKEKIEDYTGIPTSHQILSFQGTVLDDIRNVESYSISPTSTVRFRLAIVNPYCGQGGATRCIQLFMTSTCSPSPSLQQADLRDTVLQFKHKLHQKLGQFCLFFFLEFVFQELLFYVLHPGPYLVSKMIRKILHVSSFSFCNLCFKKLFFMFSAWVLIYALQIHYQGVGSWEFVHVAIYYQESLGNRVVM